MEGNVHIDISIQETANLLQAILDNTNDHIALISKDHKVICFNDLLKNTFRLIHDKEITIGSNFLDFVVAENMPIYRASFEKALDNEMVFVEKEIQVVNQKIWFQFKFNPVYDHTKTLLGIVFTATDIDIKKRKEIALQQSEANLRSIFDTTKISYYLLDENLKIIAFNQHFAKSYHEQTGFLIQLGADFSDLIIPDKRDNAIKTFKSVLATSIPAEYESNYTNKESLRYLTITVSPVISNGKTIGLCVTGYDITNTKNLELERKEMIRDLVKRNKDLQEFAQIVSHNLRGPLSTILGLTNMLKDKVSIQDTDIITDGIIVSAEKLDLVVKELNSILHVKNESSESRVTIHLDELIEEIKEKFPGIVLNKTKISCDFSEVGELFAVRSFIYNIFYNLISNSLKYIDKNRAPDIRIWTEKNINGVLIAISDNGVGIDMEKYGDHIFSLNKRFHNSEDGKGMGLFMVKAQVDVLNGSVEIDSKPNNGTIVRIILPR